AVVARALLLPNVTIPGPFNCDQAIVTGPDKLGIEPASCSVSLVLLRKTTGAAGFVMATLNGASHVNESLTCVAPFVPTACTKFEPDASVTGHVKILLPLVRVPCDAPFT